MGTRFGWESTSDQVLAGRDLRGKRIFVAGASSVLDAEIIRALVAHGADVIAADRDLEKARAVTGEIAAAGPGSLELIHLDLGSLANVRSVADSLIARGKPLDVIMADTGIVACPLGKTEDGIETQFAINHIGYFVLINRLAPLLRPGSRVVILSSPAHRMADVDLDDPNFERTPYDAWVSYGRSSTAKILFGVELDRRLRDRGIRAAVANPGAIRTELSKHVAPNVIENLARKEDKNAVAEADFQWKSIPQGAATGLWGGFSADGEEVGGRYIEDCGVAEVVHDQGARGGVQAYAVDPERAKQLWALSERLVGESY